MDACISYFDEKNRLFIFVWEGDGRGAGSFLAKVMDFKGSVAISMWRSPAQYCIDQAIWNYQNGYLGGLSGSKSIHDEVNKSIKYELKKMLEAFTKEIEEVEEVERPEEIKEREKTSRHYDA